MPVAGVWPNTTGRFLTSCGPGRGDVTGSDLAAGRVIGLDLACECDGWRTADAQAGGLLVVYWWFADGLLDLLSLIVNASVNFY